MMAELLLKISVFLAVSTWSEAFTVPVPDAFLLHGEHNNANMTSHRQRRAEETNSPLCAVDEYRPSASNHCCKKCAMGTRKVSDCPAAGMITSCVPCDSGTFTAKLNFARICKSCSRCQKVHGQVVLSDCTRDKDTVCGCPAGQYQLRLGDFFTCRNCSRCQNGTEIFSTCTGYNDTICNCYHGFFFEEKSRKCLSCEQCHHVGCEKHCPRSVADVPQNTGLNAAFYGFLGFLFATVILFGIFCVWWKLKNKIPWSNKLTCLKETTQESSTQENHLMLHSEAPESQDMMPGDPVTTCDIGKSNLQSPSCPSLPLPDFITTEPRAQRMNSLAELYTLIENLPLHRWKEFVRRLGLSDNDIETSERDNRSYRDAQYDMLRVWMDKVGASGATRDMVSRVLRDMELGGCLEKLQECL